jgi:hypothetical protein
LRLLNDWLRNFGNYFYVLKHKRPSSIKENYTNGRVKTDVSKFIVLVILFVKEKTYIHYVECGKRNAANLVLFVHGFCDFYYGWRHQLEFFGQQDYRVVAIDLRGYNDSRLKKFLDTQKNGKMFYIKLCSFPYF